MNAKQQTVCARATIRPARDGAKSIADLLHVDVPALLASGGWQELAFEGDAAAFTAWLADLVARHVGEAGSISVELKTAVRARREYEILRQAFAKLT
jgi:hypothetical protein